MIGNHPPHRFEHGRAVSAHANSDDREIKTRVRQAAEALFAPKPSTTEKPPAGQPARQPRVLKTTLPSACREVVDAAVTPEPSSVREVPPAHVARIRTWMKYGMTAAQVAELYKVPIAAIERISGKR
jgi:hypothetical protein